MPILRFLWEGRKGWGEAKGFVACQVLQVTILRRRILPASRGTAWKPLGRIQETGQGEGVDLPFGCQQSSNKEHSQGLFWWFTGILTQIQ